MLRPVRIEYVNACWHVTDIEEAFGFSNYGYVVSRMRRRVVIVPAHD